RRLSQPLPRALSAVLSWNRLRCGEVLVPLLREAVRLWRAKGAHSLPSMHGFIAFEIPQSRLPRLSARVARAAARAPKSGLPVPSLAVSPAPARVFEFRDPLARIRGSQSDVRRASVPMVRVKLAGFAPDIGEWKVVGYRMREQYGRERRIVEIGDVPGFMLGRPLCCDHCGTRRKRKETLVIRAASGRRCVEVGSGCVE